MGIPFGLRTFKVKYAGKCCAETCSVAVAGYLSGDCVKLAPGQLMHVGCYDAALFAVLKSRGCTCRVNPVVYGTLRGANVHAPYCAMNPDRKAQTAEEWDAYVAARKAAREVAGG